MVFPGCSHPHHYRGIYFVAFAVADSFAPMWDGPCQLQTLFRGSMCEDNGSSPFCFLILGESAIASDVAMSYNANLMAIALEGERERERETERERSSEGSLDLNNRNSHHSFKGLTVMPCHANFPANTLGIVVFLQSPG